MDVEAHTKFDRARELKAFDDTKAGVKGLVDAGVQKIPQIFVLQEEHGIDITEKPDFSIPIIDLEGVDGDDAQLHREIVEKIKQASEKWGFFQVVNHGIPMTVLEEMLRGVKRFYEQDSEAKKQFYTRDFTRKVVYNSNSDLYTSPVANWRDTFLCFMAPNPPLPEELPDSCRDIMLEYTKQIVRLGRTLFQILSEALGLKGDHLIDMNCAEGLAMLLNYYPECPRPELTLGTSKHADSDFLTVLLTDHVNGLQVLYRNQWVNVPSMPGALVVNIGDLLQLLSNDRFISAEHRVLVNSTSSRVSVACFFRNDPSSSTELYGPIEELVSEDNPLKYRATTVKGDVPSSPLSRRSTPPRFLAPNGWPKLDAPRSSACHSSSPELSSNSKVDVSFIVDPYPILSPNHQ